MNAVNIRTEVNFQTEKAAAKGEYISVESEINKILIRVHTIAYYHILNTLK